MLRGQGVLLATALAALVVTGCVRANAPSNCAPDDVSGTTLAVHDVHELSNHYDVFALQVIIDGCLFFHTEDTSLLTKPELSIPPRPVSPGPHTIEIASQYRSGFGADMHDYEWWLRGTMQAQFEGGHPYTLLIQRTEVMHKDPRQRVVTNVSVRED
jgi:hypothetical protein